jgi:DNA helicase-2/ATP-dependent DNA helicase PcrA
MNLTNEQREFVRFDSNALLTACPGSGKTRVIIAKLMRCAIQSCDTARKVACITYTNAGVNEIEYRVHKYGTLDIDEYAEVSTIHSFCLNNVLRNFYWLLPDYSNGIEVLPSDSEVYQDIVTEFCQRYGLDDLVRDSFSHLNRNPDGTPASDTLNAQIALEFWDCLRERGYIDYCNIVYLSFLLLNQYPFLARGLGARFAWILVDEFQDTSSLQVEILGLIARCGKTRFALVGDPCQSIFRFAGARPDLMISFADQIGASSDFHLTGNFRSSSRIIVHAERLYHRTPPMQAVGETRDDTIDPQYYNFMNRFIAITEHYIPALLEHGIPYGRAAILSPNWFTLFPLGRQLREYGIPVVGPGARPYRRLNLFAPLAEHLCAYAEEPTPDKIRGVTRELFNLLLQITGTPFFEIYGYEGRFVTMRLLRIAVDLRTQWEQAERWLLAASEEFANVLVAAGYLPITQSNILQESAQAMITEIRRNRIDLANLTVSDLGVFSNPTDSMKLLSLHAAKGREFDAVGLVSLHEREIPNWRASTAEEIEEYKRMFYVGITRPRRLLMYFTDRERPGNVPSRFLGPLGVQLI